MESDWRPTLAGLEEPASLLVFVTEGCPFCAEAVMQARAVAEAAPAVDLEVVDAGADPARAEAYDVRSVPLVVVDGEIRRTGVVAAADLAGLIAGRGGPAWEAGLLVEVVEAGRLEAVVERLCRPGAPAAFARAWRDSTLGLRMGLLAALEAVLERDPSALDAAVPDLLPALQDPDAALRGDTADLLGLLAHPLARSALERATDDPHPDVAEAAREALPRLRRR